MDDVALQEQFDRTAAFSRAAAELIGAMLKKIAHDDLPKHESIDAAMRAGGTMTISRSFSVAGLHETLLTLTTLDGTRHDLMHTGCMLPLTEALLVRFGIVNGPHKDAS